MPRVAELEAALREACASLQSALTWVWPHPDPDGEDAHRSLSVDLAKARSILNSPSRKIVDEGMEREHDVGVATDGSLFCFNCRLLINPMGGNAPCDNALAKEIEK